MKKFKMAVSLALSTAIMVSAVFAGGVSAEDADTAVSENGLSPYYTVVNDGMDKTNVSGETLSISVGNKTPDSSGFIAKTTGLGSLNGALGDSNAIFHFKNAVIPENAKALVFWFGQEYEYRTDKHNSSKMTDSEAYFLPKFLFDWRVDNTKSYSKLWETNNTVYRISTDDGNIYSGSFGSGTSGSPSDNSNWLAFKNGYIIVPIGNSAFEYGKPIDFRIKIDPGKYMKADGTFYEGATSLSCNTTVKFDNFGYITDMEAFKKDVADKTAAYKLGCMAQSGNIAVENAVYKNGSVTVAVNDNTAASYDVTLYSGNKAMYTERISANDPLTVNGVAEKDYTVQIIARNENNEIIAVSPVADVTVSINGDYNNDGKVNTLDLAELRKALLGASETAEAGADVNADGAVDLLDLIRIKKILSSQTVA